MVTLPPRNMQQQLAVMMPVVKQQITRISQDNAKDFTTFNTNYFEGKLPYIQPNLKFDITISVSNINNLGQGDNRNWLTRNSDGYDGYFYTPTAMLSQLMAVTLLVKVDNLELTDTYNAWGVCQNIVNRITWDSCLEAFELVNCSILSVGEPRNVSFNFGGRMINSMQTEIVFSTTVNDIDFSTNGWIETINLGGEFVSDTGEIIVIPPENLPNE